MGIFTGIAGDGGGGGGAAVGATINEDSATYAAALSHARASASAGDTYRITGSGLLYRYTDAGHGYLVPPDVYDRLDGLLSNASGDCYYDTDDANDTLAAITSRGFAATVNGTSSVTQPGGAGTPLVIAADSGGSNYVYWDFVPSAAKTACIILMRVENTTAPGAASFVAQSIPTSGSTDDGVVSLSDGAGEPWWSGNSSTGLKLSDQDDDADTGIVTDSTKWLLIVHGGASMGYWLQGGDGDLASRAHAPRASLQHTSGPLMRLFAYGVSGAVSCEIHEYAALAISV